MGRNRRSGKGYGATMHVTAVVWVIVVATTLWICAPATAEIIVRKDGRQIEGQVVSEDDVYVTIQTTQGTFRVKKSEILSITGRRAVSQSERDGRDLLSAGEFDRALVKFQEALAEATKPDERKEIETLIAEIQKRIKEREESRFLAELKAAEQLMTEKRFTEAMSQLESLLEKSEREWAEKRGSGPNPAARVIRRHMLDVRLKEADFYIDQINYPEAGDAYRKAIELMPDESEPYLRMARLLQRRGGRDAEIIQYYTSGVALALRTRKPSELVDDYYELGKAYIRAAGPGPTQKEPNQKYLLEGIDHLLLVAREAPTSYPFLGTQMQEGFDRLSKVGYDADTLAKSLELTLAANPQARRARWILAEVYRRKRQYKTALEQLQRLEEDARASGEPLPEEFYYRLGLLYLALPQPDYEKALDALEREIAQNRLNYLAMVKAAEILGTVRSYDKALEYCNKAIELRKERPEAYSVAADALMRRGQAADITAAERYLNIALQVNAKYRPARLKLARIEFDRQRNAPAPDFNQARTHLDQIITEIGEIEKPDKGKLGEDELDVRGRARLLLAEMENEQRNPNAAAEAVQLALTEYPDFAPGYRLQGQILTSLERYSEAKTSYLEAIKIAPEEPETYKQLGMLCQNNLKSYEEAIKYYEQYLSHRGEDVENVKRWIEECKRAARAPTPATAPTTATVAAEKATTRTAEAETPTTATAPIEPKSPAGGAEGISTSTATAIPSEKPTTGPTSPAKP